jgi:hypothetical protein
MSREQRFEEVIQQQRLQMFFASRLWLEAREENSRLRKRILELETRLEREGIYYDSPSLNTHPWLPFLAPDDSKPTKTTTQQNG